MWWAVSAGALARCGRRCGYRCRLPRAPQVTALIERCWAQEPAERPDFDEIADALAKVHARTPEMSALRHASTKHTDALDSLLGK